MTDKSMENDVTENPLNSPDKGIEIIEEDLPLIEEDTETPFEALFKNFVKDAVQAHSSDIAEEEAKETVKIIANELDDLVAKHVRAHIRALAQYLLYSIKESKDDL